MKLWFDPSPLWEPERYHYAAEQMMLTLVPGERPEYPSETLHMVEGEEHGARFALEREGAVQAYEQEAPGNRIRRYYRITPKGRKLLEEKKAEWRTFSRAVNAIVSPAQA